MKNPGIIWKILIIIGICPFIAPFAGYLYNLINGDSWAIFDWLLMYSFVYWPSYIVGIALIAVSAFMLKKQKNKGL